MSLTLPIDTCEDCPRFNKREARHWLAGHERLYAYTCTKVPREITPHDGINPPPVWCPLRSAPDGGAT